MVTTKTTAKSILMFTLVALFLFYEMGVQVSPSVMTHSLMHSLHISAVGLGFMSGFYFYTYTVMQIPAGILLDRFGVRQIVATALLVCAFGCVLFGFAQSIVGGSAARLLTGFGSAFAFVSVLAVAERWFPPKRFALLAGITQFFAAMGAMGGQLPLSFSVSAFGWRGTFFGLAVLSVLIAAVVGIYVSEPTHRVKQAICYCDHGIGQSISHIIKSRQTWFVWVYALLNWAPMAAFASLWGVPFLRVAYHLSNSEAAAFSALIWIGIGVGAPLAGYISDAIGRRNIVLQFMTGLGLVASSVIVFDAGLSLLTLGMLLFLLGFSCSGQVLSFAVVKDNARPQSRATALAVNNMGVVAAGALTQPLVGILLKHHAIHHSIAYTLGDYRYALVVLPVVYGVGFLMSLFFIKETYCRAVNVG